VARTTESEVLSILLDNYGARNDGTLPSLTVFMEIAEELTNTVSTMATNEGNPLASSRLQKIEALLAAHFYTMSDLTKASESVNGASASFSMQTGPGLSRTTYGQAALILDTSRTLAALEKGAVVGISWGGKPFNELTTWDERNR
jgi:hypothetical protein